MFFQFLSQWQENIEVIIFLVAPFICYLTANKLYITIVLNNTIGIMLENTSKSKKLKLFVK